jgi:hypothetical protein
VVENEAPIVQTVMMRAIQAVLEFATLSEAAAFNAGLTRQSVENRRRAGPAR